MPWCSPKPWSRFCNSGCPLLSSLKTSTGPVLEPVSLSEAKVYLRVDHDSEDQQILGFIRAAREYAEKHTGRRHLAQAELTLTLSCFPSCDQPIRLPGGDVISITSLKYYDEDGVQQTMVAGDDYRGWLDHSPPLVYPGREKSWPATDPHTPQAVEVKYQVGWSSTASIPVGLKQAILLIVGQSMERRGDDTPSDQIEIPKAATRLLDAFSTGAYT